MIGRDIEVHVERISLRHRPPAFHRKFEDALRGEVARRLGTGRAGSARSGTAGGGEVAEMQAAIRHVAALTLGGSR